MGLYDRSARMIKKSPFRSNAFCPSFTRDIFEAPFHFLKYISKHTAVRLPSYIVLEEPRKINLIDSSQILKHLLQLFISFQPARD